MKKLILCIVFILTFIFLFGCVKKSVDSAEEQGGDTVSVDSVEEQEEKNADEAVESINDKEQSKESESEPSDVVNYTDYEGEYKLKVEDVLYLMTSLDIYYGNTGITIEAINNNSVKGTISGVQGAPSYRQAILEFKGEIVEGTLVASYVDENWDYSGEITLIFDKDIISAKITRNPQETQSMWGIPEGEFEFVRPIKTEKIILTADEINQLESFLFPLSRDIIKPFEEGELTDDIIINFACVNLSLGNFNISDLGDKIKENGATIVFDETMVNDLAIKYFGVEVKEHQSFDTCIYDSGSYEVPALGGVSEYPVIQLILKDTNNEDIYYTIVDYMFDYPEGGKTLEYQYIIKLEKKRNNEYVVRYIQNIEYPIDFEIFNQL